MRTAFALWLLATAPALADVCALNPAQAPRVSTLVAGIARGPATAREIASQTAIAQVLVHAPISPKYAELPRAFVYFEVGGVRHGTIASVLDGVMPAPGEVVTLASRRRDPDAACAFIPWIVIKGAPAKPSV